MTTKNPIYKFEWECNRWLQCDLSKKKISIFNINSLRCLKYTQHSEAIHKWINHRPPVNEWNTNERTNQTKEWKTMKPNVFIHFVSFCSLEFCNTVFSLFNDFFFNCIVPFFRWIPFVRFIFFLSFYCHCLRSFFFIYR